MKSGTKKCWDPLMPLRVGRQSASRFCMFVKLRSARKVSGHVPVYLNVYDLTPLNGYVYWAGVGIFHTGVEVHGVEYAFGAHDHSASGVFEVQPRQCPGYRFRKSIYVGTTCLDPVQVRMFMEHHSVQYTGDSYHLILKNCNHFSKDVCRNLTGKSIPKWVNRLANLGSLCNCLLPEALKVSDCQCDPNTPDGEKRRLRTSFDCPPSISAPKKDSSFPSLFLPPLLKKRLPYVIF